MSKPNNTYENLIKENTMSEFEKMISFYREYPDYFLDSMKTEGTMYDLTPFQRVYLRSFFRFKKVGIVASRGISKCVTGNTLISTSNGLVKIGDLANWSKEEKDEFAGNYVMNINGDIEFSDMIISNGLKDTKKIRTVFGYEIEGTHVHPILVMNKQGEMEFKTLSELSKGDYVAINRKGVFGTNTKLEFDMNAYIDTRNKNQYKVKHIEVPNVMDEDLAYYLGLLQGDGCLTLKTGVIFTSIDKELIDFFQNYNREVFGLETFRRNEDRYDYMMYSVYVREYLRQIGIGFEKSNEKVIPNSIMSAPKNIVSKFLRGLFDTDGTINENYASVTTSSEEMSIQIQQLLLNFGITSKRSKRFDKKFETYSYQIYFASNNIDIFSKEINFGLKRKRDILESHKNKIRNTNVNIIPYQSEKIKKILENNTHLLPKEKKDFAHVISGENQLTYYKLKKLLFLDIKKDTRYADMLGMYEDNFFWDKVDTIEDGKDYVYDFHVPISHTFVGNGFVNHNTYLNVLAHYIKCILYPNNHLCLAMPTKEQSAKVVKEKVEEYWRDYPMLKNELILSKCKFDKDYVKLVFKNGSTLDTLTVGQSSRGLRANGLSLEEIVDERMDRTTINEVLLPILAQPRMIPRFGADLDNEYSKTQAYVTTASNKQSYCYEKFSNLFEEMEQGKATIVLGTSYEMGTRFGTLSEEDIVEKMEDATYSPLSFEREYKSIFTGSNERSLVSAEDIQAMRVLEKPEDRASREDLKDPNVRYVLSYDVARSEGTGSTANSSLVVIKCIDRGNGTYKKQVVNIYVMEGTHFKNQALFLKKKVNDFGASVLCIDNNGLGKGLTDILVLEIDENPPYSVVNDNGYDEYKRADSIPMVFLVSSNSRETKNHLIVNNFMSTMANRDVQLLKSETSARSFIKNKTDGKKMAIELLPFIQSDRLIDEVMNLEYVQKGNSSSVKSVTNKIQKDRYSALAYGLFYIYLEERKNKSRKRDTNITPRDFIKVKKPNYKVFT